MGAPSCHVSVPSAIEEDGRAVIALVRVLSPFVGAAILLGGVGAHGLLVCFPVPSPGGYRLAQVPRASVPSCLAGALIPSVWCKTCREYPGFTVGTWGGLTLFRRALERVLILF